MTLLETALGQVAEHSQAVGEANPVGFELHTEVKAVKEKGIEAQEPLLSEA